MICGSGFPAAISEPEQPNYDRDWKAAPTNALMAEKAVLTFCP